MRRCRICSSPTKKLISFGKMPIANGFLKRRKEKEFFYHLELLLCPDCYMVQLGQVPTPDMMFNRSYAYISSTSKNMAAHFEKQAKYILNLIAKTRNPFVVELGSNDGIMLKHLAKGKIRHLGIEPAANVARLAEKNGVTVLRKFFDPGIAAEIVRNQGQADVICASNTLLSVEDLNSAFRGFNLLLKNNGILFFEDPYLLDIVTLTSFDQIYDEHIYYFSGHSVKNLAQRHGMKLLNMLHQDVHGGSMRYVLGKSGSGRVSPQVTRWLKQERSKKIYSPAGFTKLRTKVRTITSGLKQLLVKLRRRKQIVVGYGATSKSTTFLNYAKIGPNLIDYISDNTPGKIGKFTPGMHIPIKDRQRFLKDQPPFTVLFAWNHKPEIFKKEKNYRKSGGKFITYFPKITIE